MSAFDDLPPTARSLLVAKANLEILTAGCLNILELAHKRNQTVNEVWHDICFKSGQPICPLPPRMLQSDYSAAKPIPAASASDTAIAPSANAAPSANIETARTVSPASASSSHSANASPAKIDVMKRGVAAPGKTASVALMKGASAARSGHRAPNKPVMLAAGAGVLLVAGVAVYMVIGTSAPANSVRPTETIRVEHKGDEGAKQAASPSVPAPEGTLRRMDGISKAFKK